MFKTKPLTQSKTLNIFLGITLVVFGAMYLLSNYGLIATVEWNKIWPLILVILGVVFIIKAYFTHEMPPQGFGF